MKSVKNLLLICCLFVLPTVFISCETASDPDAEEDTVPHQVHDPQCFRKIYGTHYHYIAIGADGTLWAWGENKWGKLGDGTRVNRLSPVRISTDTDWVSVSTGQSHSLAIKADGSLWGWGNNSSMQVGLGGTDNSDILRPVRIGTDKNWKEVVAGVYASVGIKTDGTLWTWGTNTRGYLGNGTDEKTVRSVPTQLGADNDWKSIAGSDYHCLAIKINGTLWSWGFNFNGQLGIGTNGNYTDSYTIQQVGTDRNWKSIGTGEYFSYALKQDNSLWGWGEFNDPSFKTKSPIPTLMRPDKDWKTISFPARNGGRGALLIKENGTLWAWGDNNDSRLGSPRADVSRFENPTRIGSSRDWVDVLLNEREAYALRADGHTWSWGRSILLGGGNTEFPIPSKFNCNR